MKHVFVKLDGFVKVEEKEIDDTTHTVIIPEFTPESFIIKRTFWKMGTWNNFTVWIEQ